MGLQKLSEFLGPLRVGRTHLSLSTKASYEAPRGKGGRGVYLVKALRMICDKQISVEQILDKHLLEDWTGAKPVPARGNQLR